MKKILYALTILLAACQTPPTAPPPPAPAESASAPALLMQLRTLIADNSCSQNAQCLTVAVGARACGGPEAWLPYSTAGIVAPEQVGALAGRFSAARQRIIAASHELSTCAAMVDPGAQCVDGGCRLRTDGGKRR